MTAERNETEAMMYQEEIVIYVRARSPQCRRARRILERRGYAFEAIDVGPDEESRLLETTGKKMVPLVFLDGRLLGGLEDIRALEYSGDLDRLVRGRV